MAILTDAEITELKQKNGRIYQLEGDGEVIIVKAPSRAVWSRFGMQVLDEAKRAIAVENLVRECVLWPEAHVFEGLLDRKPAMIQSISKQLSALAGVVELEKKAL